MVANNFPPKKHPTLNINRPTRDLVCLSAVKILEMLEEVIGVPMNTVLLPASRTYEICERFPNRPHFGLGKEHPESGPVSLEHIYLRITPRLLAILTLDCSIASGSGMEVCRRRCGSDCWLASEPSQLPKSDSIGS